MSTPAGRRMALDILLRTLDHGRDLQAATAEVLAQAALDVDKGLATELAYGYLRFRGRLDFLLNQLLRSPSQTSPVLRRILGLAAYELLFLTRIPDYATLDWAVTLTKKRLGQTMAKLANGVLRNLVRLGQSVHRPEYYQLKTAGQDVFLAAWYACPLWLVRLWLGAYGPEQAQALLAVTLTAPGVGVRLNRGHPEARALQHELAPLADSVLGMGLNLRTSPDFLITAERQGVLTRQSLAAQSMMQALGVELWPSPILDACCGRGGKTFLMAESGREVWAADVNMFRLRQFRAERARLGCDVPAFRAPAQGPYPLARVPRTIFLDVPCSGLGVLSRRPDIKWKRTIQDCAQLAALQREILLGAANVLPVGGCLVYLTCTLNPAENEGQIDKFVRDWPQFVRVRQVQTEVSDQFGEFFFGAVLHKTRGS